MNTNEHIDNLIELRTALIKERRACALDARAERLPEIVARIEAIDKSIVDEQKLAELLSG